MDHRDQINPRVHICWRYNGIYYILHPETFPNQQKLFKKIGAYVPTEPAALDAWITSNLAMLHEWDTTMRTTVFPLDRVDIAEACQHPPGVVPALAHPYLRSPKAKGQVIHDKIFRIQFVPYHSDHKKWWVLTFDFDNELLTVNNYVHFNMRKFPRAGWVDAIKRVKLKDANKEPYVVWPCVPRNSVKKLDVRAQPVILPAPSPERRTRSITERENVRKPVFRRALGFQHLAPKFKPVAVLLECIWNAFLRRTFSMYLSRIPYLNPTDFVFREVAYAMIAIVRGLCGTLTLGYDDHNLHRPPGDEEWFPAYIGGGGRCFASRLGGGFHERVFPPGSAPAANTYWPDHSDTIVHLTTGLENDEKVRVEINIAAAFGRATRPRRPKYEFSSLLDPAHSPSVCL